MIKNKILTIFLIVCMIVLSNSLEKITIDAQEQERNIRINDSSFTRQNLQTGETIPNIHVSIIIESLGAGLIILFIIIYAVKKKGKVEIKKNDNN